MFLGSFSRHNKELERWTLKRSARHSCSRVIALRQISVTALFYLEDSRRIHPRSVRACQPKDTKETRVEECLGREGERERVSERVRERERALWLLLLYVFFSTWACPMQLGLSQECSLFCLKSSLWSSDLPLTLLVF